MRIVPRRLFFAFFIAASICTSQAPGQDKPLKKINWGVTSLSAALWIPWLAKEAKIYDKHPSDFELLFFGGQPGNMHEKN